MKNSGPSRLAQAIVSMLIPPACREEVLGDLHERFRSPLQYAGDAVCAVPLVILSRMRRVTDPQIVLIQAFALYISFLSAAWLSGGGLLREQWGLIRLAIPAAMVLLGLTLEDTYATYATSVRRSALSLARGPLLGLSLALASQGIFWIANPDVALPRWIMFDGCAMSLLLCSAVRMLFPPVTGQLLGVNAPELWLKREAGSSGSLWGVILVLLVLLIAYRISKH